MFVHRADCQFRIAGRADLLHQDDVEFTAEAFGDQSGHGQGAAGDGKHQWPFTAQPGQRPGQFPGGIGAILERKLGHGDASRFNTRSS